MATDLADRIYRAVRSGQWSRDEVDAALTEALNIERLHGSVDADLARIGEEYVESQGVPCDHEAAAREAESECAALRARAERAERERDTLSAQLANAIKSFAEESDRLRERARETEDREEQITHLANEAVAAAESRAERAEEALGKAISALRMLVHLKDEKDTLGKTGWYQIEQPKAWDAARAVLAGPRTVAAQLAAPGLTEGDEKKLTCAASAPGVPSPTKGSDAGGDGDGSRCPVCDGHGYVDASHGGPDPIAEPCPHPMHDEPPAADLFPKPHAGAKCEDYSPPGFAGHWRDWHRGHGCELDPSAAHRREP